MEPAHPASPREAWQFDHLNVSIGADHALRALFEGVMDMHPGYRPPFPFPGLWLYEGDQAMVHAVDDDSLSASSGEVRMGHIAFRSQARATDVIARLQAAGLRFRVAHVPADGTIQIFVPLPGGLVVELDVPGDPDIATSHQYSAERRAPDASDI